MQMLISLESQLRDYTEQHRLAGVGGEKYVLVGNIIPEQERKRIELLASIDPWGLIPGLGDDWQS